MRGDPHGQSDRRDGEQQVDHHLRRLRRPLVVTALQRGLLTGGIQDEDHVQPPGAMGPKLDGLLHIGGARGAGDQIQGPR